MKRNFLFILLLCLCTHFTKGEHMTNEKTFTFEKNPLIRDKFTADPAPMVYNGRLYLYVGHDEYYEGQDSASGGREFNITEWLCYSTDDMKTWVDHGSVLKPTDFKWAVGEAWASQVVEKNGKFYYYTTVQAGEPNTGKAIGVAVGDSPTGPFTDAIGKPLITDKMTDNGARGWWNDIDPTVLIDQEGQAWLYWGNGTCFAAKLKPNMIELDGEISVIDVPNYTEGPWLHYRNGIYYLTYASMGAGRENISYATSRTAGGPWTPQGELTGMAANSFTIHPGIIEYKGKWYLFYHNAVLTINGIQGAIGRRSVCFGELQYNEDGTIKLFQQDNFDVPLNSGMMTLTSPQKKVSMRLNAPLASSEHPGKVTLQISTTQGSHEAEIFNHIALGLETDKQQFNQNLRLVAVSDLRMVTDDYTMVTGKRSHCINTGCERVYTFENSEGQILDLTCRVYDDGIAFRYHLPHLSQEKEMLVNECTAYTIPKGVKRWIQPYDPASYERFYPLSTDGEGEKEIAKPRQWGYPALIEPVPGQFALITEANLMRNHSASFLDNTANSENYRVRQGTDRLPITKGYTSPWHVMIIGSLATIVESTLVTDVSEPCTVAGSDWDWVKPAPVSWIYWAHNHGSKDFQIVKQYVDLAVDMKWPYVLIDWEWSDMANGGNIEDALAYAHQKGVKPMLWYNSSTNWIGPGSPGPLYRLNTSTPRKKEFEWLNKKEVSGIKIDFFKGDDVNTINYYLDLLEDAALYKIMITFHGATVPRGWQRTYPHLMTVEGVYGAEWYNNAPILTSKAAMHNCTLPFTRNVIGSMDYTPGTFSDSQHKHITSHGHELALPIIFESGLQHMPDRPETYTTLPKEVQELLFTLPTSWDETRLLDGYPADRVIMARRKGNRWYIAGLNGTDNPRKLTLDLQSLGVEGRTLNLFKDGKTQYSFDISTRQVVPGMQIECLPRGGFVAMVE